MVFDPLGRTRGCPPGDLYFLRGEVPSTGCWGLSPMLPTTPRGPGGPRRATSVFFENFFRRAPKIQAWTPTVEPASPMPSNREPGSDGISPGELMQSSSKLAGRVVGVLLKLFKNIDLQNWIQKDECCCRYSQQYGESLC